MGISSKGRIRRVFGAAVVALVVVGGPVAGTASARDLDSFSGMGSGFALRVTVDLSGLPDTVKNTIQTAYAPIAEASGGELPAQFPFVIDQRFIETLSEMGAANKARSLLGSGFRDFEHVAEVTKTGSKTVTAATQQLPSADLPVLDVTVGELVASIAKGPKVSSNGEIARVSAQLEALSAVFPDELEAAFDAVTDQVNDAISTTNATLDDTLGEVATSISQTNDPVIGGLLEQAGLGAVVDDPAELTSQLQSTVNLPTIGALLEGDLASISALKNVATTQKASSGVVSSDASSRLAAVNALGLVKTGLINVESHSEAAGVKGSAKNASDCSIADVSVGGSNGLSLDGQNLYVNGTAVPVPAANVGTIKSLVNNVLSVAGLSVALCDVAQAEADADGTSAAQRVSAFRIEFAPKAVADVAALGISAGDELVKIVIDPTVETSVAAQVAVAPQDKPSLPRTGAGNVVTILGGIGLAGAAIFARKRLI